MDGIFLVSIQMYSTINFSLIYYPFILFHIRDKSMHVLKEDLNRFRLSALMQPSQTIIDKCYFTLA